MSRVRPIKDVEFRKEWSTRRTRCQVCGRSESQARADCGGLPLSTHHICRFKRSDEPTNFLRVCQQCHDLIHDGVYRDQEGKELPRLTFAMVLTIKHHRDPVEFDLARLQALFGRNLPEPELPPSWAKPVPAKSFAALLATWTQTNRMPPPADPSLRCPRCRRVGRMDERFPCPACNDLRKRSA